MALTGSDSAFDHWRFNEGWAHGVDPDTLARVVQCRCLGQAEGAKPPAKETRPRTDEQLSRWSGEHHDRS